MGNAPTCGKGLARHSALPAKLGDVMEAGAEILEFHTKALDPADRAGRRERDAYRSVARQHQAIARELRRRIAAELAAYQRFRRWPRTTRGRWPVRGPARRSTGS